MAISLGKLQKRKNIIWTIIWKRDASREDSQGSMIVSCEILIFANPCSNMIEMKMFVSNGTILQNKISHIEWQNRNIFITDKIGGSLSLSLETLADHWKNVLTSTKRCLHQTVYTENLEDNNSGPCPIGSTRNGNRHRVLKTRECLLFVRLQCLFLVVIVPFVSRWFLVHTLWLKWLKFAPCVSHRHRHVSCGRWVTLSSTSPSNSLSFSSSSLASSTSFCSSPSLR